MALKSKLSRCGCMGAQTKKPWFLAIPFCATVLIDKVSYLYRCSTMYLVSIKDMMKFISPAK